MKKIVRLLTTALIMAGFMSMSVFAKESDETASSNQEVSVVDVEAVVQDVSYDFNESASTNADDEIAPQALGKVIGFGAGTITGGSGTITVSLPSGNWWADFVASISYTTRSDIVNVSVRTPEGNTFYLGTLSGTGSQTSPHQETYAPAGDYLFYFSTTNTESFNVSGYIYD